MDQTYPPLSVRVWGELACFTRPDMKVERVSYPVPTPSAARGMLEAIFWKPQFAWQVEEIWILRPIRYFSLLRNEVNSRAGLNGARGGYVVSADRTQRHTLALRDVAYLIRAHIQCRPGVNEDVAKYRDQFRRRVAMGRCFATPYLGCREFAAAFAPPDGREQPFPLNEELGLILYDLSYAPDGSGRGQPHFFPARLERGILRVPPPATEEG